MSQPDLPYDYEDFVLDEAELIQKYADTGEHPEYTVKAYQASSTEEQDAHNGYWDWVTTQIIEDEEIY